MASIQEKKKKKDKKSQNDKTQETVTLEVLKTLGHDLLSSRAHINNLPILLSVLSPSSPFDLSIEALISLQSFFIPLLHQIPSKSSEVGSNEEKDLELVYKVWLRERFDEFVKLLIKIAVDSSAEEALKDVVLDAIMDFLKSGKDGKFQSAIYHRFLHSIVHSTSSVDPVIDLLAQKYFKYLDVRSFTYTSLDKIAKDCDSRYMTGTKKADLNNNGELFESRIEVAVRHIYNILSHVPPLESADKESSYETWSQSEAEKLSSNTLAGDANTQISKGMHTEVSSISRVVKKIKLKFTKAWLSFLRLPLPLDIYKEVLVTLHENVFPYMANPAILCDFLTKSYDIGGVISVMALSGLFVLMTQHGLEYPKFYEKLYALLTPAVFMAKHRAMFFQLLDSCLKSSHLPAYLAAAFAKKLSRLALSVPPPGELVVIALIHNLLRRHPSINFLVHKVLRFGIIFVLNRIHLLSIIALLEFDAMAKLLSRDSVELCVYVSPEFFDVERDPFSTAEGSMEFCTINEFDEDTEGDASLGGNNCSEDVQISEACSVGKTKKHGVDPFRSEENDPSKSDAMRSSLWEIDSLRHHYCPAVSRFVASLENDLTVRAKTTEVAIADFSSGSYATIFREEIRRRIKQVPLAFYKATPNSLFCESDFPGWSFGSLQCNTKAGKKENRASKAIEDDSGPAKRQRLESTSFKI